MMTRVSSNRVSIFRPVWVAVPVFLLTIVAIAGTRVEALDDETPNFAGPVRIAMLLWAPNPEGAATTLEQALQRAIARRQLTQFGAALEPLRPKLMEVLNSNASDDPRRRIVLAGVLLTANNWAEVASYAGQLGELVVQQPDQAGPLLAVFFFKFPNQAFTAIDRQLQDERPRSPALRAYLLTALEMRPDEATRWLQRHWGKLDQPTKVVLIEPLTAARPTMLALLSILQQHPEDKDLVNPNQLRKWISTGEPLIVEAIRSIWGRIRMDADAERKELVEATLRLMRSGATGSVSRGEAVFQRVCSQCHRLHGKGYQVGPDLDRNGRGSLEQLVSNVLDPSLVIGEAFQAKTVLTVDGQVITGLVEGEDEKYLRLKTQGGKTIEFAKEDIEVVKASDKSLMPEGVEQQMSQQELLDLFAFLCLAQSPDNADNELIPGVPEDFVQP